MAGTSELGDGLAPGHEVGSRLQQQEVAGIGEGWPTGLGERLDHPEQGGERALAAALGQGQERGLAHRRGGVGAREHRLVDRVAGGQPGEIGGAHPAEDVLDALGVVLGQRLAIGDGGLPPWRQLLHGLLQAVAEVVVHRLLEAGEGDVGGLPLLVEARRAHRLQAHARMLILGLDLEQRERLGHAVAPVAQHAGGGGAGMVVARAQHALEQGGIDHVLPLMDPQRLHQVVLVGGVAGIQAGGPLVDRLDDLGGIVLAELDLGPGAHIVLGRLEQLEQGRHRRSVDPGRRQQRPALVGHAVDAPVLVVAVGVAEMVLHVADDGVRPVHEVERAVGGDADPGRAEIRIIRGDEILQCLAMEAGAFLRHFDPEDALHADDVAIQEAALEFIGEVAAREDGGARAGPRRAIPELLHALVLLRVVDVPAEGRGEEVLVAGGIGDDVGAPVVEHPAVGVGEAVGDIALEALAHRLIAVDRAVGVAHRTGRGLDLGAHETRRRCNTSRRPDRAPSNWSRGASRRRRGPSACAP